MKFIHSSIESIEQAPGKEGLMRHIELAGRVSYKSEDKITEDSADKFVRMLIARGHTAPLEHGTVYLKIPKDESLYAPYKVLFENPYTTVVSDSGYWYVTTNYRVIVQNTLFNVLSFMCETPTEFHSKRYTYRITCSRGVTHELVRHRSLSFTQESSRYCNYSKDKFGSCLTFIIPSWVKDIEDGEEFSSEDVTPERVVDTIMKGIKSPSTMMLISANVCCEQVYLNMLKQDLKAQEARDVLTNGIKTEIVVTTGLEQWKAFFALRSPQYGAKGAHPDMAEVADAIYQDMLAEHILTLPSSSPG